MRRLKAAVARLNRSVAAAEKANFLAVYRLNGNEANPKLIQLLPTGIEPEGVLAIPQRNLVITANEGAEGVDSDCTEACPAYELAMEGRSAGG